ncbi:MAG: type IV pilin N-terminal domain-containing protein [Methanocorpusculum sp.]|nr:type IV pilin N-terminal domain-containing protein [Methanocorpusculum sp.]
MTLPRKTNNKKTNEAVSPVIGVMLMLVVTIVIAAFVSMFAGTTFADAQAAPSTVLNVKIVSNGGADGTQDVMLLEHVGGSSIPSSDMKITTYYTSTGTERTVIRGEAIAQSMPSITVKDASGASKKIVVPILSDVTAGSVGDTKINFGKYEFESGSVASTYNSAGTWTVLGFTNPTTATKDQIIEKYGFTKGSKVTVNIIHTPSQAVLYNKEVVVQ